MKEKTKMVLASALSVLALGGLATGGYYIYKGVTTAPKEEQTPVTPDTPDDPTGGEEQPLTHTVTFTIEGQDPITQTVANGGLITEPDAPTREGYIFQGWALQGTTDIVDFSTLTATENMTFVAIWIEEPALLGFVFENGSVSKYTGEETDVVIPATYSLDADGNAIEGEDYQVTAIGRAFSSNKTITSVTIPNGVTYIDNDAFYNCTALVHLTIPDSVEKIGTNAFVNCPLEYFQDDGLNYLGCDENPYVVLMPTTDTTITSATISDRCKVTYSAFVNCTALENIEIPASVKNIGAQTFLKCSSLAEVTIPKTVTDMGRGIFSYCTALKHVEILAPITALSGTTFSNCTSLESVILPDTIIELESQNFTNCTSLAKIDLPKNLQIVGQGQFRGCTSLTEVTIPASVTSIANSAFRDCKVIICEGSTPATLESGAFSSDAEIYVPDEAVDTYKTAWTAYADPVKPVSEYGQIEVSALPFTFSAGEVTGYSGTEAEVVIPATYSLDANGNAVEGEDYAVTSIGSQAFVGSGITKLTIPSSVTNLATNCFQGMVQNLIVVFNGENPPQMNMTFNHGSLMIYVPKNAVATYQKAWVAYKSKITASSVLKSNTLSFTFEGGILTGLVRNETDIIIPSSYSLDQDGDPIEGNDYAVTGIGAKAFYDNNTITSITIPACITSIGDNAFFSCSNLASIKVEEGNAVYDSRNNCNAIIKTSTNTLIIGCQNTVIPGTITSIEKSAFCGCEGLTSITIPDNVTRIERETFMGCVLLTSITISENVNYIGYEAFGYCFNLESIFLEGTTPPTIDLLIFDNSSPTIYVPDKAVDAYKEAWADYADQIKPVSEYVEA